MGGMGGALLEGVMTSLGPVLQRAAAHHGERLAVLMDGPRAELLPAMGRGGPRDLPAVVFRDRAGQPGRVMLPNVPAFPIAFYGRSAPGPWSCR